MKTFILKNIATMTAIRQVILAVFLVIMPLWVYWGVTQNDFINYDDPVYVTHNMHVQKGLSFDNLKWAFRFGDKPEGIYWHPLTWISHMFDCRFFGLSPGSHHFVNLFFHIINTLILFWFLARMTNATYKSAMVALIFALHPVNVETVAWIAERKNVLSTFFWFSALLAYDFYCRRTNIKRFMAVAVIFTLGLMSKPILVTFPCVLFLMDYWPLERFSLTSIFRNRSSDMGKRHQKNSIPQGAGGEQAFLFIVLEKIALFAISLLSVSISFFSVPKADYAFTETPLPFLLRLENALVSYCVYLKHIFVPGDMAIFYPFPQFIPLWQVVGALAVLSGVTLMVLYNVKKRPFLFTGWFWYLGTLVPVIGLVMGGDLEPAFAFRNVYVPAVGIMIMCIWGIDRHFRNKRRSALIILAAAFFLSLLVVQTKRQVRFWKNSVSLFEQALRIAPNSVTSRLNLAVGLGDMGRNIEAIKYLNQCVAMDPKDPVVYYNLGICHAELGHKEKAVSYYLKAIRLNPRHKDSHVKLGTIYLGLGKWEKAVKHYNQAIKLESNDPAVWINLGVALSRLNRIEEAADAFKHVLRINSKNTNALFNIGGLYLKLGQFDQAIFYYQQLLQIDPTFNRVKPLLEFAKAHRAKATLKKTQEKSENF